jgi:hypothetical protein
MEPLMRAAITFLMGLMTTIGGLALRACSSGGDVEMMRSWCGPAPHAFLAQSHAHCAGCAMLAAGLALMIAAIVGASLPRRRVARENP